MLSEFLPGEVFAVFLVFVRVGAVIMLIPALGENSIPARIRLSLALLTGLVVAQVVRGELPPMPDSPVELLMLVSGEFIIGAFIGASARLLMTGLHVAGGVIAFQSGLAMAQAFDTTQGTQGALMSSFFTLLGVVLVFAADLHLLMLAALRDSYYMFPPGDLVGAGDFAQMATQWVSNSFTLGIHISAPFLVYGVLFYSGVGILSRVMPQVQIFFIAMPLQIILAFFILMFVLSTSMLWFVDYFEQTFSAFIG